VRISVVVAVDVDAYLVEPLNGTPRDPRLTTRAIPARVPSIARRGYTMSMTICISADRDHNYDTADRPAEFVPCIVDSASGSAPERAATAERRQVLPRLPKCG